MGMRLKRAFLWRETKFSLSVDKIMYFFSKPQAYLCVMIVRWAHFQHIIFQHEGYWCERVYFNPNHNDFLNRPDSF